MNLNEIICGDSLLVLKTMPSESIDCCITSPPYWGLRDYGVMGQLGLEKTPEEYVAKMVNVFREVKRVLKSTATLWLNLGDSYNSHSTGKGNVGGIEGKRKNQIDNTANTHRDMKINRSKDRTTQRWGGGQNCVTNLKDKDLVGIPWRVAFALQTDGWYLRQDIIWHKPNPMPESVTDRCTKSHEYIFLLSKNSKYYFDNIAIQEDSIDPESHNGRRKRNDDQFTQTQTFNNYRKGFSKIENGHLYEKRNKRSVWTITTKPYRDSHFATFPEDLVKPMILAGCPEGGIVLDPFMGAGTTGLVAKKLNRNYIGIELNPKYAEMANKRINRVEKPLF